MPKKKSHDLNQPVTQRQFKELIGTIREMGTDLFETMQKGFKQAHQELQDFRLEQKHNWEEQWRFNQEISQKVDVNTDSIRALDKKVRYQNDMPERLDERTRYFHFNCT